MIQDRKIVRNSYAKDYANRVSGPFGAGDVLRDVFLSRGATFDEDGDYSLARMLRPDKLKGLSDALELLHTALLSKEKILIVGDFDADGATSTALAIRCLRAFGHSNVDFLVPNRFIYGYGLTPQIVEDVANLNADVILTVDNGISSIAGVTLAKEKNIKVIVTDHHLPSASAPPADAIINPNQNNCDFESKHLAGVGVVFYLMSALRSYLRERDWFLHQDIRIPNMAMFLDLVALGTVADVVPLDYNNRVLVAEGIKRINAGLACPGIRALLKVAGADGKQIAASDMGFSLGPRINAAGRLDDMSIGIRCLLADNFNDALSIASELDDLNKDRKLIESAMKEEALTIISSLPDEHIQQQFGICLYKEDWHQGVIGILASRIKERLHRPTIVFADADDAELKGSGRSIPEIHLRDILDEVANKNPGMLEKFGGHAMAAGLSLCKSKLDAFQRAFNHAVAEHLDRQNPDPLIHSDGCLSEALLSIETAEVIRAAGPWGQRFTEPTFDGVFTIVQQRLVGRNHLKLLLSCHRHSAKVFDAIAFNVDLESWPNQNINQVQLAFRLDVNEYRGERSVQLVITHLAPVQ